MPGPRFARRLLAHGDALGLREELIGDLLEEIARGRSRWWVCEQLIALFGFALIIRIRSRSRVTPAIVALALCLLLFAGVLIASATSVLLAWLGFYCVMGTLSLFAHMAASAASTPVTPESAKPEA